MPTPKDAWKPRKEPRQARSRATFDAILEACARILRESGLAGVSTTAVAERADVGVGSLYEFFPGREAILATLVERRLAALAPAVEAAVDEASRLEPSAAVRVLIARLTEVVSAGRALFRVVLRDVPMLRELPETRRAIAVFFELGRVRAARARGGLALPAPEADAWLIGRMVANAVLEIAFLEAAAPERAVLVEELARLTFRMLRGRDIDARP
jgi:AcrR family transcriptional regulator